MRRLRATKAALRRYALTLDGAYEDHPWGENVAKVKGRVFVFMGVDDDRSDYVMGVKLTRSLLFARSLGHVEPMGYGLGKAGWCSVKAPADAADLALMKEWITESYQAVAPKPKAVAPKPRVAAPKRRSKAQ